MRKILNSIYAVIFIPAFAHAQVNQPRPVPDAYAESAPVNYVRTWDPQVKLQTDNLVIQTAPSTALIATQYLDGLGRPIQTVAKNGSIETHSNAQADMVSASEYDEYGRIQFNYLSFAANNTGGNTSLNDGYFKLNPFQQQAVHVAAHYPAETFFYGKTEWEDNPQVRVTKNFPPGQWIKQEKFTQTLYQVNTATDGVIMWEVAAGTDPFGDYNDLGTYPTGTLNKQISIDEAAKQTITYTDKEGKVILKKVQLTALADNGFGSGHAGWLCTYYIYDELDQLRCVIQPEGVKMYFEDPNPQDLNFLNEQCFRYRYDSRGRMIVKKIPGADEVRMVYDLRDRLVMTQDGNNRADHKWMYTKYDVFNKVIETGNITDNTNWNNQAYHTALASASTDYPNLANYSGYDMLTQTYYNNYDWATSLPSNLKNFSITYASSILTEFNSEGWDPIANEPVGHNRITGVKQKVLNNAGTPQYLYSISFYDNRGRVSQTRTQNLTGGIDAGTTQYDWRGKQMLNLQQQENATSGFAQTTVNGTHTIYDLAGRVQGIQKKLSHTSINGGTLPNDWHNIVTNEYDKEGKLKNKILAPDYEHGLETETFDYNIRGWTLGMNRGYVTDHDDHYFGFDLGYENYFSALTGVHYNSQLFNGNIAGTIWKSKGDGEKRRFDYSYDAANRLTGAAFTQLTSGTFNTTAGIDFSVSGLDYDGNGNILHMNQKGLKINSSSDIDLLSYTYMPYSNKLKAVTDGANDNSSKLGDFKYDAGTKTATDYLYDGNGNMVSDANKKISSIVYNYLNLPKTITITGKGTIDYVYAASGNKLRKITTDNTVSPAKVTTTDYMGTSVYEDNILQFTGQEEGRVRYKPADGATPASFSWDYFMKDHLGNVRAVITEDEQIDHYPAASMETSTATTEELFYANLPSTRSNLPSGYPTDNFITPNAAAAKVGGGNPKIGPAVTLKVMAGDKFDFHVSSWYKTNSVSPQSPAGLLTDLVTGLLTGISGATIGSTHAVTSGDLSTNGIMSTNATTFLNNSQPSNPSNAPKAYVNWILFDEQFNFVQSGSGAESVPAESAYGTGGSATVYHHTRTDMPVSKNGYLYIFVSNETPNIPVYFDNLQITHKRGHFLEETHYYPFGLTMAGISSKAAGQIENKNKFNRGTELNNNFDISFYETDCRLFDPQIGRFWQVDELAEANWETTPYNFGLNNPVRLNDPSGLKEAAAPGPGPGDDEPTGEMAKTKTLATVAVSAKRRLSHNEMQSLYWKLRDGGNGFSSVKSDKLRERLERWDGVARFMERVHADQREQEKFALEVAANFIPLGWITKSKYVRYAATLFKLKRGVGLLERAKPLITILGKAGWAEKGIQGYEKVAAEMGYNSFQVPDGVWKAMSDAEKWAANEAFLSDVVLRGDEIIFSKRVAAISEEIGFFRKELEYLSARGYHLTADGLGMIK